MSLDKTKLCTELLVKNKIQETADTFSFVLEIPSELKEKFKYQAGQFVTFFVDVLGEEVRRSYSLASCPELDPEFKVTVKRVPGGKLSNYLIDHIHTGDSLWTTPPAGKFLLPKEFTNAKLAFYAAGSGITPIISLIQSALHREPSATCFLLFQNRDQDSIIFKNKLDEIVEKYPGQLVVDHILSQPKPGWKGLKGRVDAYLVREFLTRNMIGIRSHHTMCGPEGFMNVIESTIQSMGIDPSKIVKESFLSSAERGNSTTEKTIGIHGSSGNLNDSLKDVSDDAVYIGDKNQKSSPMEITATFDGSTHTVSSVKNMTILESLLESGKNPPYSCMDGACMACIAKVTDGLVYQNDMGILTEDNIAAKECLTCQARPASKKVTVNFEIF